MPTQKVIGSKTFTVPTSNDTGWGVTTTAYLLELGTYANQVAIASYDLTKNFRVNSTSVVADGKTVAQYGMESTFVAIKNYSASSAKFGALRLPEFGPAGSDNTYTELSASNSNLGTFVSHSQINWKLAGGYFYLHANNPATYSDAALVVQKLNSTNSPINNQTALAAAVADTANLNVDTIVLTKTAATLRSKAINLAAASGNVVTNSDVTDKVAIFDGSTLGPSAVTKAELATLAGINTGSTVQTRIAALEASSTSVVADIGNLGSTTTGIIAKTTESGTDVYTARTITGTANRVTVTDGTGVAGNPTLDIGTDVVTLTGTQTLQNKEINTNINTIKGTANTVASFDASGNMVTNNTLPDSISFPTNEGIESTSAASTLNVGTGNNTSTLNLGTSGSTSTVNIGTGAGATTINIGGSGDTVNISGTLVNVNTTNMDVDDNVITVNKGGTTVNTSGAGISIEGDAAAEVGYIRSDSARTGTEFKSADRSGTTDIRHSTAAATNVLDLTSSNGNTYSFPANTGNVLIDTASQTVVGKQTQTSMAFVAESATVTTANLAPVSTPPKVIQRITASTATLGTITNTGGATNSELILVNVSGGAISILNDSGASSTSILTGTGSAISLANNASVIVIYDANSSRWRVIGGSGSGGAGSAVTNNVNQAAHGFSVGNWLYLNGTTYTTSINTSEAAAQPVGVVTAVIDANNFTITTGGVATGLSGLTAGAVHYVASTAGAITATKPFIVGQFEAPVGVAISTTSIYVACQIAEPASRYTSNNEQPVKNYLRAYSNASVDTGTVLTLASTTANLSTLTSFYADATPTSTVARSTDSTLRGTTNYLSAVSGSNTNGSRFFQFPAQQLDGVDLGKPISISFDVSGVTTDGNWDAVIVRYNSSGVYQNTLSIAGNVSSASAFPSAKLPTGTTTFNGFFVPDSTTAGDIYALRLRSLANAVNIRVDTLFIGPQPIRVGSSDTDWQSYTPAALPTNTTLRYAFWRKVGDSLEARVSYACTGAVSTTYTEAQVLPTSRTVNQSLMLAASRNLVGHAQMTDSGITDGIQGEVQYSSSSGFIIDGFSATPGNLDSVSLYVTVPITGWSSNTTMADRAVEEYASTSGTWDADSSTTVYGPQGSLMGGSLTSIRAKTVTWTTAIQSTDRILLELSEDQISWFESDGFINAATSFGVVLSLDSTGAGAASGGCYVGKGSSANQSKVNFCRYASVTNDDAPATNWPSNIYWRLRKVSGGAQVGYPISVDNLTETVGTWTPTIAFGGASVGVTYSTQSGTYQKIGRTVHFRCYVVLTSKGSSTGVMTVGGLPFAAAAAPTGTSGVAIWTNGISRTNYQTQGYVLGGTSNIYIEASSTNADAAGAQSMTQAHVAGTASFQITGSYIIA